MDEQSAAAGLDRGARESPLLEWAVRAGLVGYGVVHLLVAVLAVRVVLLGSGDDDRAGRTRPARR